MRFIFLFALLICMTSYSEAEIIRRAAFDFGSGKIKVQVADVDTKVNKIVQSLYSESKIVLLSDALSHSQENLLNEEIQNEALSAASYLKNQALELGAQEFYGLATEAYRKASNGQELIDRYTIELQIPVKIISQEEEGKNGFLSLVAEKNLPPDNLVAWDIGSGSLQVTYLDDQKNMHVYMAPFGRTTTKNALIQYVKNQDPSKVYSPNPMSQLDWESSLAFLSEALPGAPEELIHKLKKEEVMLVGLSAHPEDLRVLNTYRKSDILHLLEIRLGKTDQELLEIHNSPPSAISELALIYSVMEKLEIEKVNYIRTQGGTSSGLLVSEDYWPRCAITSDRKDQG